MINDFIFRKKIRLNFIINYFFTLNSIGFFRLYLQYKYMGSRFIQKILKRVNILKGVYKTSLYFIAFSLGVILLNSALTDIGVSHNMAIALSLIGNVILQKIFFAIHETGHALAVKAVNYNLHVLRVGQIGFNFKPLKFWRFKSGACDDFGGYILMTPSRGEWSRKKDIIILLAGSGLSLCFAIICLFASFAYIDVEGVAFIYESFGAIKMLSFLYLFMSWPSWNFTRMHCLRHKRRSHQLYAR